MTESSDAEVTPDAVVRTALQLLPIPAHPDDFWTRLDAALDAEPPLEMPVLPVRRVQVGEAARRPGLRGALGLELERDSALALVPPALRRTSNGLLARRGGRRGGGRRPRRGHPPG